MMSKAFFSLAAFAASMAFKEDFLKDIFPSYPIGI